MEARRVPAAKGTVWDLSESGWAVYKGNRFPLKHANRRLLARLVQDLGHAVPLAELRRACMDDYPADKDTLRSYLSKLRQHLRLHLDLPRTFDPIPHEGRAAWRLALT
jgi:DNA-binding response OmpR family regulator